MNNLKISRDNVCRIILNAQLLNGNFQLHKGNKETAHIINKLGYIQIDTISVINRAHHHILWTRNNSYSEKHLHESPKI